ncbi:MAG: GNAT family N-acetyltransferase [Betaproteobacteria bacterium]|nr:GNAT family N-acetyltransferase [Betaproteobacteria bacterium]
MSTDAVHVRLADTRDAQGIALMSRDLIESGLGWRYDAPRVARGITDRDTVALVACEGRRVIGFAMMQFGEERAHLALLAVRPTYRRRGVARRLVEWLVESAMVAGIATVHLELRESNQAAKRFYRAMGFSETALVPGYYQGKEAALRMLRVLRRPGTVPYSWRPPRLDPH